MVFRVSKSMYDDEILVIGNPGFRQRLCRNPFDQGRDSDPGTGYFISTIMGSILTTLLFHKCKKYISLEKVFVP